VSSIAALPYATGSEIEGRWVTGLRRLPTEAELPSSDGVPVETPWHRDSATLLLDSIRHYGRDRADWWCAADIFLYFNLDMVKNKDFRGPDFFVVKGVPKRERKSYVVWEEGGHFPNVIVELVSDSTRSKDFGEKKAIYEKVFQTPEYYIVELDGASIQGWRLEGGKYKAIKGVGGKLRCEQLGLDIGLDSDTIHHDCLLVQPAIFPRFYYPDGRLLPTPYEAALLTNAALLEEIAALKAKLAPPTP
jgi:Uma2 family endonuclease